MLVLIQRGVLAVSHLGFTCVDIEQSFDNTFGSDPSVCTAGESENDFIPSSATFPFVAEHPAISLCKQSQEQDVKEVLSLENTLTRTVFGELIITDYIEKGICRSLFNENKELVAFIAVEDHPNLPTLAHCNWQGWIKRYYRLNAASPWNTLFIHYVVWDLRYPDFFSVFLKHFYKSMVQLEHIIMILPPGMEIFNELWGQFTCVYPTGDGVDGNTQFVETVYLNLRPSVIKKLLVRKAGEEDNIDVQPILHCQYELLKHLFGDFKLSSVIDLESKEKAILVAEVFKIVVTEDTYYLLMPVQNAQGVTVGVLALTCAVNYQHVNDYFHVPLENFTRAEELRSGFSKLTMRYADTFSTDLATNEDLFSLEPDLVSRDTVSSSYSMSSFSGDRSISTIYLDDDDTSEFRIVDPAIQYIMSKKHTYKRPVSTASTLDSLRASHHSLECNTYYGRPSYSTNVLSSTEVTVTRQTTMKDFLPPYLGPEDGFTISMFALHPDLDIRLAFDMLEASFECYLNKNYCLLSLPTNYQGSPLIKYFVRLTPRLSRDFPHELYFVHRNSIFSEFKVRILSMADLDGVTQLIENLSQNRKVRKDLTTLLTEENTCLKAYLLECEDSIIGVAVIGNFMLEELQPHYKLEEYIRLKQYNWEKHGVLRHAVISVMFLTAAPFFLRQVMHQAGIDTLSYCLYPPDALSKSDVTIPTVLGNLRPVRPREKIVYNLNTLDIYTPKDFVTQQEQDFALFITTDKLLNISTLELNYRVVVVGASDTALSFLENLIYSSAKRHIRYNNITLVSIHGFPLEEKAHKAADRMLPGNGRYTKEFLSRLSLQTHINIIYGVMTVVNRAEKMISINDEHWLRYDYLFLFTGSQYCKPVSAPLLSGKDECQREVQIKKVLSQIVQECGDNLFLVNTSADASIVLGSLKAIIKNKRSGKIIVHGNTINIYTCVEALLTFGVPGNKIVLVESANVCKLRGLDTNSDIERAVLHSLQEAGVILYHGYSLINWTLKHRLLHSVMFLSDNNIPLTLDCLALFCYSYRGTSARTYMAVTNSGLVYNNGIIINNQFLTNDSYIYAAGPGTTYSSRYQAPQADHVFCNSLEVGKQVSYVFRRHVEPWPEDASYEEMTDIIPQMKCPITLVARLPGGWNYLRVSAPGRPLPLECQLQGQGDSGPVLITGDPIDPEGPGYFQLSLSSYHTIREIVCLSKHEIPHHNLQSLYGQHEKVLNNLLERFNYGVINDLFAYFSEPWAYALYTTDFKKLVQQCADIFNADEEAGIFLLSTLEDKQKFGGILFDRMSDTTQEKINQMYASSSVPMYVQNLSLKYVSERTLQLPMYMTDQTLAMFQRAYTVSPLHHKSKHKPRDDQVRSTP